MMSADYYLAQIFIFLYEFTCTDEINLEEFVYGNSLQNSIVV